MTDLIGPVSIARCAELLTEGGDRIDRSALSRYCDTHGLKLPKQGKIVPVDFETVRDHRVKNYTRELQSGQPIPPPAPVAQPRLALVEPAAEPAPAAMSANAVVASMPEHRGLKAVQLRQALRDEAIAEGLLTRTDQVDAGAAEAIVEMRAAFAAVRPDLAERLAAELGLSPEKVRVLRSGLKRYDRLGQERFAKRIAQALRDGNESEGEAADRLRTLTWVAGKLRSVSNRAFAVAAAS